MVGLENRKLRSRGAALVVTIVLLAVLLLLAVSFSRLMRLERAAGGEHQVNARARLSAESGVEFALARIRDAIATGDDQGLFAPYGLDPAGPDRPADLYGTTVSGILRYPSAEALVAAGVDPDTAPIHGSAGGRLWESYAVAVRHTQSMVNLNAGEESLARILDTLGAAIDPADPPVRPGDGARIVSYRNSLPERRFSRVEDLQGVPGGILDEDDLERLDPFVTIDSWVDEKVIRPPDPASRPAAGVEYDTRWLPGRLDMEPRAPVDLNTASEEVLTAVLAGVAGNEEVKTREPSWWQSTARWAQKPSQPIDFETARSLARKIVENRETDPTAPGAPSYAGPFRTWDQFEAFLDARTIRPRFTNGLSTVYTRVGSAESAAMLYDRGWNVTNLTYPGIPNLPLGTFDVLAGTSTQGMRISGDRRLAWRFSWWGFTIEFYTGTIRQIAFEFPEGTYIPEGSTWTYGWVYTWAGGRQWGYPLTTWTRVQRVRFIPRPGTGPFLWPNQVAALKANANPNTRFVKFNPDAAFRLEMDKSDLTAWTTEFCFWPMGSFQIDSMGYVHSESGELIARHGVRAIVRTQRVWRETTQADFAAGTASAPGSGAAPVSGGRTLVTYPQPAIGNLPQASVEDGAMLLATYQSPSVGVPRSFRASFEDGFDAEEAGGTSAAFPDTAGGPTAGDLLQPAVRGNLYPDGGYCEEGRTPSYRGAGNMGGRRGTIAFWVKPNWSATTASWSTHKFFEATSTRASNITQSFQVGAWGWGTPLLGFQFEAAHSLYHMHDGELERVLMRAFSGEAGEWQLVTVSYDFDSEDYGGAIEILVNADPNSYRQGWYTNWQNRAAFPSDDITADNNLFSLGGRSGALIGGTNSADATVDELTLYPEYSPSQIAGEIYRLGRYYNGGDATFTSQACPWTTGTGLPPAARVARIAWTQRVPAEVPGGRIRMEVQVGSVWSPVLDDPAGSRVDLVANGPVRYRARFEETAREGVEPLLASPSLDDVTIFFVTPPEIVRWETEVPVHEVLALFEDDPQDGPEDGPGGGDPAVPPGCEPGDGEYVFPGGGGGGEPPDPGAPPGQGQGSPGADIPFPGELPEGPGGVPAVPPPGSDVRGEGAPDLGGSGPMGLPGPRGGAAHGRGQRGGLGSQQPDASKVPVVIVLLVVEKGSGKEVPRAKLDIETGGRPLFRDVRTNQLGRFRFTGQAGELYRVTVTKPGYADQVAEVTAPEHPERSRDPGEASESEEPVIRIELARLE
ncbi:MAG: hypothetical protein HY720_13370 [Planctomycetes bacterium]|nr:hypothetical protein [Planctomycetota bacterium]